MCVDNKPSELMERIAKMPAPRYWVSENRAAAVISLLEKGWTFPPKTIEQRKRLFTHLYLRYKEEKAKTPDKPLTRIVLELVLSPAPESFLSPSSIPRYIIDYREKIISERRKRQQDNEQKRKDTIPLDMRDANVNTCDCSSSVGIDAWISARESLVDETDLPVSTRQLDSSADKPIQPTDYGIPIQCETKSTRHSRTDFNNPAKRFDRCHTNHRYIRNQLRLVWNDGNE